MNRMKKWVASYILYPLLFAAVGTIVILIAGRPVLRLIDAQICMQIINGAPETAMNCELRHTMYAEAAEDEMTDGNSKEQQGEEQQGEEQQEEAEGQILFIKEPEYGTQYGSITCERAGLTAPLYYGDNEEILRLGAGQYTESAMPGTDGVSIIGAHDATFFAPLEQIKSGDRITITTSYGEFRYEVEEIRIAKETDESVYQSEKEQVILYTCYPFGVSAYEREDRYYVYCSRTE